MKIRTAPRRVSLLLCFLTFMVTVGIGAQTASRSRGIFGRDEASSLLPATVFYRGQVAPIQARNSAGFRLADSKLVLAGLVDTSGYASSVQQTYQGYLITEVPLEIGGARLVPGCYGFGFIAGNHLVVMDVGANQLLSVDAVVDAQLSRPNPLQILPDAASATRFRLYVGRSYVTVDAEKK